MKYFIDTKFHEYSKQNKILGIKVGKPVNTIELISIGIVSEGVDLKKAEDMQPNINEVGLQNGDLKLHEVSKGNTSKEYYAICKEFDLNAAMKNSKLFLTVLMDVYGELLKMYHKDTGKYYNNVIEFRRFKYLLNRYGKTKEQIGKEIFAFVNPMELRTLQIIV